MDIALSGIGKRYGREWILRDLNLNVAAGERLAILGANGSGKSTLIKIIAGYLSPSKGHIDYRLGGDPLEQEQVYSHCSIAAPYLELYTRMTLKELIRFHFSLKEQRAGINVQEVLNGLGLPFDKELRSFSSGMLQRVSIVLAMHTESSLLLLDEPSSNLDSEGIAWLNTQLSSLPSELSIIIASNVPEIETKVCHRAVHISELQASTRVD